LRSRYIVLLISLLLFIAAVDTIPDPPALNPPSSHSCGISAFHIRGSFTPLEHRWQANPASLPSDHLNSSLSGWILDDQPAGIRLQPLVFHATDTSPPVLS
jgi:hypothetical protein